MQKQLQTNIPDKYRYKNYQQSISKNEFNSTLKELYTMTKWDLSKVYECFDIHKNKLKVGKRLKYKS